MNLDRLLDKASRLVVKDGRKNWFAIFAIFLLILSPLTLTAALTYRSTRQDFTAFTLSQRRAVAYFAATALKEKLDHVVDVVSSLASRQRFRQLIASGQWDDAIQILTDVPKDFPFIDRIYITDLDGNLMSDIPAALELRNKSLATRDWYMHVTKSWKPYVSRIYERTATPRSVVVAIAAPIKSNSDGQPIGILIVNVKVSFLLEWTDDINVGDRARLLVVDQKGGVVANPGITKKADILDYANVPLVQKVLRGHYGVEVAFDPIKKQKYALAYEPVPFYGWGTIVEQPESDAFALRDHSLQRVITTYVLILILNCILAYLILKVLLRVKRAEENNARLASVVESSDDAIFSKTLDGTILTWNKGAEKTYGYCSEEVLGRSIAILMPDEQADEMINLLATIKRGESIDGYTTKRITKDGRNIHVSLTISPIRDDSGNVTGASIVARDITHRRHLEDELREKNQELEHQYRLVQEANRLKSEFLANMSHELRTPLNAIIGFAQLMHDAKVGPISSNHKEYLEDILTSGRHLLQLINDILDLSKIEAGKLEFTPELVNLPALVGEVRQILQSLTATKRLTVAVEISPALREIVIDPAKLKQVLYNYLSNAIKFTPEQGRITIRALPDEAGFFRLEVEDNGIGIPSEQVERLFTEFQQLDASIRKRHQGTGLGLALTRKIVQAQGGRVGVQSTQRQGSIFYAILPRNAAPQKGQPETSPIADLPSAQNPKLLIVEDNEKDRAWLVKIVGDAGYAVDTAKTGAEAVAKLKVETYTAILLDLILPDMIGWDILHAARAGGPNQHTPVIVVTVVTEKEVAKAFRVHDCLVKPVAPAVLIASLDRAGLHPHETNKRILVIDDDPNALKIASAALKSSGYEAICHPGGRTGLEAATQSAFAAIILDLLMPEVDGFEFLEHFRKRSTSHNTPVIVWTHKDITVTDRERLKNSAQSIALKDGNGIASVLIELERHLSRRAQTKSQVVEAYRSGEEYDR